MKLILLCAVMVSVSLGQPSKRQKTYHNDGTLSDCNCGWRNSGRIVGGKETHRNEYPWMVALQCGPGMCGGSIITEFHVLTAGHCTQGIEPHQIIMVVARHNISNPYEGEFYYISKIIRHKDFTEKPQLLNDISLLVTKDKIKFYANVGPVCLPSKRFNLVGKQVKVTGWGVTKETGEENVLHEADFRFVPLEECQKFWLVAVQNEKYICVKKYQKDVCYGDSGSPLVYLNTDNSRYTQVALVSFSNSQCESLAPVVNTDVFSFIDWIIAAISKSMPGVKACAGN